MTPIVLVVNGTRWRRDRLGWWDRVDDAGNVVQAGSRFEVDLLDELAVERGLLGRGLVERLRRRQKELAG